MTKECDIPAGNPAQNLSVHVVVPSETPLPAYPVVPPSPMRPSTKRSASTAENLLPEAEPQRKKGRIIQSINHSPRTRTAQPKPKATLGTKRSVRVLRSSRLKNASGAPSLSRSSGSTSGPSSSVPQEPDALKEAGANSNTAVPYKRATNTGAAKAVEESHSHLTASTPFTLDGSASSSSSANSRPIGKSGDPRSDISHDAGKRRHLPPAGTVKSMGQSQGSSSSSSRRPTRRTARMPIPERPVSLVLFFFHSDSPHTLVRSAGKHGTCTRGGHVPVYHPLFTYTDQTRSYTRSIVFNLYYLFVPAIC